MSRHLVEGKLVPGAEVALLVDQVLPQDVLGTLAMLDTDDSLRRKLKPCLVRRAGMARCHAWQASRRHRRL